MDNDKDNDKKEVKNVSARMDMDEYIILGKYLLEQQVKIQTYLLDLIHKDMREKNLI